MAEQPKSSGERLMATTKDQVMDMIRGMPDSVTIEDIMAELHFRAKVDAGLRELDEGKGIPHEDVEKRLTKWLDK